MGGSGLRGHALTGLVAIAIVGLWILVIIVVPSSSPAPILGSLPLATRSFDLPNQGMYYPPCSRTTFPVWWAAFVYTSNRTNASVHVTGAWTATRETAVLVFDLADDVATSDLGRWQIFAHCPINPPSPPPPVAPPSLPRSGSVDSQIEIWPNASRLVVQFLSFDRSDNVQVTEAFMVAGP